jgi:hypothetical protein
MTSGYKQTEVGVIPEDWGATSLGSLTTLMTNGFVGKARQAGVQDKMFGVFHDAGYRGLYGGLGSEAIKTKKSIPAKEQLLDRMNDALKAWLEKR